VLTSEIAFGELKRLVENFNNNIQHTQSKIEEIEKKLKKTEEIKTQSGVKENLQKQISEKTKLVLTSQQKLIRLKGIQQKIFFWSGKILERLGVENPGVNITENLSEIRKKIRNLSNVPKAVKLI